MSIWMPSLRIYVALTLLTGVAYPTLVTVVGQGLFSHRANGSLIERQGRVIGSELLAQKFESPRYFWPRPSAADYATVASGASNAAPTSRALFDAVEARRAKLRSMPGEPPADLLLASGSGLDPDISPAAAFFQVSRVALARGYDAVTTERLRDLVTRSMRGPQGGLWGAPRVNVLSLNLALDRLE